MVHPWPWELGEVMSSMYLVCLGKDGVHDGDDVGGGGEVVEAQHALELLQAHHRRRARHEPHDRRVRQEVHDEAQPRSTYMHAQDYIIIISRQLESHYSRQNWVRREGKG